MMVTEENPAVQKKLEELIDANRPRTWQEVKFIFLVTKVQAKNHSVLK